MANLSVHLDGNRCWPDLVNRRVHYVRDGWSVAALPEGMTSGMPSVAVRIDLADGSSVVAETSLRCFLAAADALRVSYSAELGLDAVPPGRGN